MTLCIKSGNKSIAFVDCHTHSKFSIDSNVEANELCLSAIEAGLKGISITDHVELNPIDPGYNYYNTEKYFDEIRRLQDKYSDKLRIFFGLEFGDPHQFPKQFEEYKKLPYDIIIGSVHHWYKNISAEDMPEFVSFNESLETYFIEVVASIRHGGFDVIGHLGFPKKFFKRELGPNNSSAIDEILLLAVKRDIILEVNTSSLSVGMNEPTPSTTILNRYIELGGKCITLGSDAHTIGRVGADFKSIGERYIKKLKIGHFEHHKFQIDV